MQEKKTETEQLYDELTDVEQTQEETEEQAEQEDEEIQSEEELEIEREIESYQSKIDELDAKLAAHEAQHIDAMKREQMKKAYYSEGQIERYIEFVGGTTAEEIAESVSQLAIPAAGDNFGDPSAFNGAKQKPQSVDKKEVGRNAIRRVIDAGKIRL